MHGLDGWMRLGTLPIPTKPMSLVSVQPPPLNRLASSRKTVCTQTIVDTMPKDSETPRYAAQRTHRTYTRQFKAQLVAACHQPGVSIAALALHHGVNTNVLHRWLKEHARSGCHQITVADALGAVATSEPTPQFLPVQLPVQTPEQAPPPVIRVELRKGSLSMAIMWPTTAAVDCAAWMREVLR